MPLNRALLWIFISILTISGTACMGWLYYLNGRERRLRDEQYRIVALVQRVSQGEALKSIYLAELLNLSLDRPINLYAFNLKEAKKKLQACPLIKRAKVKKILPGTLYIDYEVRTPVAYLGDIANTVIDEEGILFPFRPFFTPKCLPILYLGREKEEPYRWGNCLKEAPLLQLAWSVLKQFEELLGKKFYLRQLDIAQAFAESEGKRQIILVLEERAKPAHTVFLRLNVDDEGQSLANFQTLQGHLFNDSFPSKQVTIDMRLPQLAFIK